MALRTIAASCRADLSKYRNIVLQSRRPIGIHQARVALRRLRAAFSVFRPAVDNPEVRALSAEARWLAGECGPARDLHVFLTESVTGVSPVVKRVGARLAASHLERARAALGSARYEAFDQRLAAFAAEPASMDDRGALRLDEFGRHVLDTRHSKVVRRGRLLDKLSEEQLHRLRIGIKKLRYAAIYLSPAFASPVAKPYIEATVRLQGALGALNDRATAARMLADIATASRPSEDTASALKVLARQASSGEKRRRRKLERTWKEFRKVERFWRA
ncbi:CHAD domain-containing protein [Reyranella sp.]|uniref:CHAD domain-containing protein n=1 Tax=Reyranella sp. TaxID=1929291 RepID=UPI00271B2C60|nr:CHAD domain-containing protein [Reyranella sp.]MDO8975594.1 CHAD domain-containing protein [Reyranella sp.]